MLKQLIFISILFIKAKFIFNQIFASSHGTTVNFLNLNSNIQTYSGIGKISSMGMISNDLLATGTDNGIVFLWNVTSYSLFRHFNSSTLSGYDSCVTAIVGYNETYFITAHRSNNLRLWSLKNLTMDISRKLNAHGSGSNKRTIQLKMIISTKWSTPWFASSSDFDKNLRLWYFINFNFMLARTLISNSSIYCMEILSDDRLAYGLASGILIIYDFIQNFIVKQIYVGEQTIVKSLVLINQTNLAFGLYSNKVITLGLNDFTLTSLYNHSNSVLCVELIAENLLASGSKDKSIIIWDLTSNTLFKQIENHSEDVSNLTSIHRSPKTNLTTNQIQSELETNWTTLYNINSTKKLTETNADNLTIFEFLTIEASLNSQSTIEDLKISTKVSTLISNFTDTKETYAQTFTIEETSHVRTSNEDLKTSAKDSRLTLNSISVSYETTQSYSAIMSLNTKILNQYFSTFNFYHLNLSQILEILKMKIDLNACILNCSGNGECKLIDKKFICKCFSNYFGSKCDLNMLACSSNPCRNSATCINNFNNNTYSCECYSEPNKTRLFYGNNCENKVDLCENETCSNNGVCYDSGVEARCKCFKYYDGIKCELETNEIKIIKTIIKTSLIIAVIVLILTYCIIIFFDISNIFMKCKPKRIKKYDGSCLSKKPKLIYISQLNLN